MDKFKLDIFKNNAQKPLLRSVTGDFNSNEELFKFVRENVSNVFKYKSFANFNYACDCAFALSMLMVYSSLGNFAHHTGNGVIVELHRL